jgi:uncharacterized protein (TIGR02466 family)
MNYDICPLFSVPFYISEIELDNSELSLLVNCNYERKGSLDATVDKYLLNRKEFANIRAAVDGHIENYTKNVLQIKDNIKFNITTSWGLRCKPQDYSHIHYHGNSLFSGVVYFNTDENSGSFKLYDSVTNRTIIYNYSNYNIFNSSNWYFNPKKGNIYLFPSHVNHEVTKNNSTIDRYSIAFNTFFSGQILYEDLSNINLQTIT